MIVNLELTDKTQLNPLDTKLTFSHDGMVVCWYVDRTEDVIDYQVGKRYNIRITLEG